MGVLMPVTKSNPNESLEPEYRAYFIRAKALRRTMFLWWLAVLPATGIAYFGLRFVLGLLSENQDITGMLAFVLGALVFLYVNYLTLRAKEAVHELRCPKCGQKYLLYPYSFKCGECGLMPN